RSRTGQAQRSALSDSNANSSSCFVDVLLCKLLRATVLIDGHVGKHTFGHLLGVLAPTLARPGFNFHRDRGVSNLPKRTIATHLVADRHRTKELHGFNADRCDPSGSLLGGKGATGEIHLGQGPSAEDASTG